MMDVQVRAAAICYVCKCSVDIHEPHAIIKFEYAHLDCADAYDARDLGGLDLPPYVEEQWPEDEDFGDPL
jgi:hypothetical protein